MRAAAALLLLLHAPAAASPLELFGFGGRSPALAATGVAAADDYECLYLNPAGLAEVRVRRLSAGTLLGSFQLDGVDREIDAAAGIEVGAAFPLPLGGFLRDRVGAGFGIYVPTTVLNRARAPRPGVPFFTLLENRTQVVGVQVGVGVKVTPRLSLGGGVLVLGGLAGGIDVSTDALGRFATTSEQQLIASYSPLFGARFHPSERLALGATFRFAAKSTYDILITADLGDAIPITLPEVRVAGVAQYDPMALALEAAWRPARALLLTGQLSFQRWSAYPLPTFNPIAAMPPQEPPGFHDTLVPRLGLEWGVAPALFLRAGYAFILSPAPEMTGAHALVDNHRHVLSGGIGLVVGPFHADLWVQGHLLVPRDHDRPDDQPDIRTRGNILVGGLMLGVDL